MNNKKEYVIFSQLMAGYLMTKGFVLKKVIPSNKDKDGRKNVFVFTESEELLQAMKEYKKPNN